MTDITDTQNDVILDLIAAHKAAKDCGLKVCSIGGRLHAMSESLYIGNLLPSEVRDSPYTAFIYCKLEVE